MKRRKEKFPFTLKTQKQRKNYLKKLKIGFWVPLLILGFSFIMFFPKIENLNFMREIIFMVGYFLLEIFLITFWIINLIVMWEWKRKTYFWFSLFIPVVSYFFYFTEFFPFLKTVEEEVKL